MSKVLCITDGFLSALRSAVSSHKNALYQCEEELRESEKPADHVLRKIVEDGWNNLAILESVIARYGDKNG